MSRRDNDLAMLLLGLLCLYGTSPRGRARRGGGQRPYGSVEQAWPEGVPPGDEDNLGTVPLPGQAPAVQPPAMQSPGWHPPMA